MENKATQILCRSKDLAHLLVAGTSKREFEKRFPQLEQIQPCSIDCIPDISTLIENKDANRIPPDIIIVWGREKDGAIEFLLEQLEEVFHGKPTIGLYAGLNDPKIRNENHVALDICLPLELTSERTLARIISLLKSHQMNRENTTAESRDIPFESDIKELRMAEFLSSISHDLKSPLHGIINFSGLGIRRIDKLDREKLVDYMHKIQLCGQRILNMVNDLVDLSKLEAGLESYDFRDASLSEIISIAINENSKAKEARDITIDFAIPEFRDAIKMDPQKILQVFNNLISNAIKFSETGSSVEIEMEDQQQHVRVKVVDHGIGLGQIDPGEFFNKYTHVNKPRLSDNSTGLGLAICRYIVEDHGGSIQVRENQNQGLQVIVEIPKRISGAGLKSA